MSTEYNGLSSILQSTDAANLALDAVLETQAIFRTALNANAWPGSIRQLPAEAKGAPVNPWAAGLLITLLDHEVSLAVDEFESHEEIGRFIRQRSNPGTEALNNADFVLASGARIEPELVRAMKRGSLSFPDDGATLVVLVDGLNSEPTGDLNLTLNGPGIAGSASLSIAGLSPEIIDSRNEAVAAYPCGIDLLFVDSAGRVAAIPRSSEVSVGRSEEAASGVHRG